MLTEKEKQNYDLLLKASELYRSILSDFGRKARGSPKPFTSRLHGESVQTREICASRWLRLHSPATHLDVLRVRKEMSIKQGPGSHVQVQENSSSLM